MRRSSILPLRRCGTLRRSAPVTAVLAGRPIPTLRWAGAGGGRRTAAVWAALVVAVLPVGACAGSDDGGVVDDGAAVASSTSSTGATVPATTTSTTLAQTPLPSGREAIDALLAAWEVGDRAGAGRVATPEAVEALFAVPVEPRDDRGCNGQSVQVNVQCVFRLPSGELQVRAAPTPDGAGYLVDFVLLGS